MAEKKQPVLFALSTCPACKKTKEFLNVNKVDYILAELDTIDVDSRNKLLEQVRKYNPRETFPTLVIHGGEKVLIGCDEAGMREAFNIR